MVGTASSEVSRRLVVEEEVPQVLQLVLRGKPGVAAAALASIAPPPPCPVALPPSPHPAPPSAPGIVATVDLPPIAELTPDTTRASSSFTNPESSRPTFVAIPRPAVAFDRSQNEFLKWVGGLGFKV